MLNQLFNIGGYILQHTGRMNTQQWLIFSVVAVLVGAAFVRGFESKGRI